MHPSQRLSVLAARKSALRTRIAISRVECAEAGRRIEETIEEIAAWRERLRRFSTIGSIGVGLAAGISGRWRRKRRHGEEEDSGHKGRRLLRWIPVAVQAFQLVRSAMN